MLWIHLVSLVRSLVWFQWGMSTATFTCSPLFVSLFMSPVRIDPLKDKTNDGEPALRARTLWEAALVLLNYSFDNTLTVYVTDILTYLTKSEKK